MSRGGRVTWLSGVVALFGACAPQPPWSEPPPLSIDLHCESSVETVPLLGEFELRLDLFHREDLPVDFDPEIPDGCAGEVELLSPRSFGHGRWQRAILRLRALEGPGELVIASFRASAEDGTVAATTPELTIEVTSLLTDEAQREAGIEAPGPLLESWRSPWPIVGLGVGLLAVLLALWWFARRRRVSPMPPSTVLVPPHVKAMREFTRLRAQPRRTPIHVQRQDTKPARNAALDADRAG